MKSRIVHIILSCVFAIIHLTATAQFPEGTNPDPNDSSSMNLIMFPRAGCVPLKVNFNDSSLIVNLDINSRLWDFGDGSTSTEASPEHIYNTSGTFTVTLTTTDQDGEVQVFIFDSIIHTGTKPVIDFQVSPTDDCASTPFKFYNRVSGNYTSLIWYFGDGDTSSRKAPIHYYLDTGWMSPKLKVDNNGCIDSLIKDNYVHVKPPIVKMKVSMECDKPFERTFTARFIGDETFDWDFGDGTPISTERYPVHTYTSEGRYLVKLSSTNKTCTYIDTVSVIVVDYKSSFDITASDTPYCRENSVKFKANNTTFLSGFYWEFGDGTTSVYGTDSEAEHTYAANGIYSPILHAVDVNGCESTIMAEEDIQIVGPISDFMLDEAICTSSPVAIIDATVYDSPATSFYFDFGDGQVATTGSMPVNHIYQNAGTYDIFMRVVDGNGCSDTTLKKGVVTVIDHPVAAFSVSDETICQYGLVNFFDQSKGQELGRTWHFPDGNTSNLQNPQFIFNISGNQVVKLVIGEEDGCISTMEKTINVLPAPNVVIDKISDICLGDSTELHVTGANSYSWNYDPTLSCLNCANPTVNPEYTTLYHVIGTDGNGCKNTDSIRVKVTRPFSLSMPEKDTLCDGNSMEINAIGGDSFIWSPTNGLSDPTISNPVISPATSTTYTLIATDSNNCFSDTAQIYIMVVKNPSVNILDTIVTLNGGNHYKIQTEYSNDAIKWNWDPATNLSCTDCPVPETTADQIITYTVTTSNIYGCTASDRITVRGLCSNETIYIPNTFSPNGDNHNDYFYPRGSGLYKIKSMRVFNRWGQHVFEKTNFSANEMYNGWDGKWQNKQQPSGVYIYIIEIICNNGTTMIYKGDISLL